jgi:hypothetical protein
MKLAHHLLPTAACLLAAGPLAQAGDAVFSRDPLERQTSTDAGLAGGWVAGASSMRLDATERSDGAQSLDGAPGADHLQHQPGLRAAEIHAGYHGALGLLDYAALVRYDSIPDLQAGAAPGAIEHGALSAVLGWRDLYARYDYTFTHGYPGGRDARGGHYLDIGARHAINDSTWLHLNAGDRRVGGDALWNWRDIRAGFTRQLDDGWTMALNYRRVYGNASVVERYGGAPRFEGLIPGIGRGRRGVVLTLNRGF